ncbi:MAG TPA: hypothetical protein VNH22_08620 [Blastocatellia bacterium]|jgi:hypothetical protein|nr:hypothetical protein [Blastocatellia bacterium]
MSSTSQAAGGPGDLNRAEELKNELVEFATAGPLKKEYERQHELFFELSDQTDEHEEESVLDWFLFDWFDENGESTISLFLNSREDLSEQDQQVLLDWEDSINSVFEIRSLNKNSLKLSDLDNGDELNVTTITNLKETPFKRGQCIAARLLPFGDKFILSGLQFIMPDRETALEALEMRRALEALNSPEAIEKAQQEQCSAFCELFGCAELTVPSSELTSTLGKFQHYLFTERRDAESGLTQAEKFQAEFNRELKVPDMPPLPDQMSSTSEVTILCDEFDGIVLLPDYTKFKRVFESDRPGKAVPDYQDVVWTYIKDPDIPIVAFERMAEQYPDRVEKVLRTLIGDKKFSIEHLYALLLHYKQPVEELSNLEDDQRLWDLLNGNAAPESPSKSRAKKPAEKSAEKPAGKSAGAGASTKKAARRTAVASSAKSNGAKAKSSSRGRAAAQSSKSTGARKTTGARAGGAKKSRARSSAAKKPEARTVAAGRASAKKQAARKAARGTKVAGKRASAKKR